MSFEFRNVRVFRKPRRKNDARRWRARVHEQKLFAQLTYKSTSALFRRCSWLGHLGGAQLIPSEEDTVIIIIVFFSLYLSTPTYLESKRKAYLIAKHVVSYVVRAKDKSIETSVSRYSDGDISRFVAARGIGRRVRYTRARVDDVSR